MSEYKLAIAETRSKGARQINILGGEPLLHRQINQMCNHNFDKGLKTTIYTNGLYLGQYVPKDFHGAKIRVSVDCLSDGDKPFESLRRPVSAYLRLNGEVDINFMIGGNTTLSELKRVADEAEGIGCKTFFISSYRYLDNNADFFKNEMDLITSGSMNVIDYKELVHAFLWRYTGNMEIHISKRGVFESVINDIVSGNCSNRKCNFANYFIGGKIIQCPYDVVNLKYAKDYEFGQRYCQHNSTCLMSKIIVQKIKVKRRTDG